MLPVTIGSIDDCPKILSIFKIQYLLLYLKIRYRDFKIPVRPAGLLDGYRRPTWAIRKELKLCTLKKSAWVSAAAKLFSRVLFARLSSPNVLYCHHSHYPDNPKTFPIKRLEAFFNNSRQLKN